MDKKTRILIACAEVDILSAAIQMQLAKHNVEVVSVEQIKERGITLNLHEPIEFKAHMLLEHVDQLTPPLTRRERRAQERRNKK